MLLWRHLLSIGNLSLAFFSCSFFLLCLFLRSCTRWEKKREKKRRRRRKKRSVYEKRVEQSASHSLASWKVVIVVSTNRTGKFTKRLTPGGTFSSSSSCIHSLVRSLCLDNVSTSLPMLLVVKFTYLSIKLRTNTIEFRSHPFSVYWVNLYLCKLQVNHVYFN